MEFFQSFTELSGAFRSASPAKCQLGARQRGKLAKGQASQGAS